MFKAKTMRLPILFLILCLLLTNLAMGHRENSYYLYGNFGDEKVAIVIDEFGENCMARYFTNDDLYDHVMEGTISPDRSYELYSSFWDENKKESIKQDHLLVKEVETDIWKGTWKKKDGQEQDVYLRRIVLDSLNHPYAKVIQQYGISPYEAYRTRKVHFEKRKKEKISKGASIVHCIDQTSGVEWFRVLPGRKSALQVDSINNRLIADHIKAINAKYSCVYLGNKGEYKLAFKVHFLNARLISYTVEIHSACYGGPGNEVKEYHNLALQSLDELKLEDLYWLGDYPQPELSKGEYKWTQYRYKTFAPKMLAIIRSLYPEKFSDDEEKACSYGNQKNWFFPDWYLTAKGLMLISTSSLSSNQCKPVPSALIPYAHLAKYSSTDFGFRK